MKHLMLFEEYLTEKKWVGKVETKFHTKPGIFTQSSEEIAKYLKKNSKDLKQAMSRLVFYINRSGKHMKDDDRSRLEVAKEELRKLY